MKKKITFLLVLLFAFSISFCFAQSIIEWEKNYGGSLSDQAYSVDLTLDNGLIVSGFSESNDVDVQGNQGSRDAWILKINSSGDTLWTRSYGGSGSDAGYSVLQTYDGGYAVAGVSNSTDGDVHHNQGGTDYWMLRLDENGDTLWTRTYGGSSEDICVHLIQTFDSGFAMIGATFSSDGYVNENKGLADVWVIRLNAIGDTLWTKSLGGTNQDYGYHIAQTADSGFILACYTYSNDGDVMGNQGFIDYWIVKLDANGTTNWAKTYGGTCADIAYSIKPTSDGNFIVGGFSCSDDGDVPANRGGLDFWLLKISPTGDTIWSHTFGGSEDDQLQSLLENENGGFVAVGFSKSSDADVPGNNGEEDFWVMEVDSMGTLVHSKNFGGSENERAANLVALSENTYAVAGYSFSEDQDVSDNHGSGDYWVTVVSLNPCTSTVHATSISICFGDSVLLGGTYQHVPGMYTDTLMDTGGCDSIVNTTLTVDTALANITQMGDTLLATEQAETYQWYDCSSEEAIAGATDSVFVAVTSGSYALIVEKNDCADTSSCVEVVINSVPFFAQVNQQIRIYPTPASSRVVVERLLGEFSAPQQLQIFDVLGKVFLAKSDLQRGRLILDVEHLPEGSYCVMLQTDAGVFAKRFLKIDQ